MASWNSIKLASQSATMMEYQNTIKMACKIDGVLVRSAMIEATSDKYFHLPKCGSVRGLTQQHFSAICGGFQEVRSLDRTA
jgi:hypothetical protein